MTWKYYSPNIMWCYFQFPVFVVVQCTCRVTKYNIVPLVSVTGAAAAAAIAVAFPSTFAPSSNG